MSMWIGLCRQFTTQVTQLVVARIEKNGAATSIVDCCKNRFDRKLSVVTDLPILVSDWVIHFYDDDKLEFDVPIINDLGNSKGAIIPGLPVRVDTLFRKNKLMM